MADAKLLCALSRAGALGGFAPTNIALDASGDKIAWVFQPYSADPITHLGFRYGARTGTPPEYLINLQGVTAAGVPDATILGGGSPASVAFTPPADASIDGLWQWKQLDNAYTPTRGQVLAAVLEYSSGTVDGSNNSSFTRGGSALKSQEGFPYNLLNTGSWTKSSVIPHFGWRTANGRFGFIAQSAYVTNSAGTAGHRSAMHFTLPAGHGDTFQLLGVSVRGLAPATGTTFKLGLWDASSELQSATFDSDHFSTSSTSAMELMFADITLATLSYGTKYYVGFEVIGTAAVGLRGHKLAESEDRTAFPYGDIRGLATFDGSNWTDDNTVMPQCDLIFADITEPAGGGGGGIILPRSMNGGLV